MKTIRILYIGIMALALALASGSAEARLILKIEDPALPDGVVEVVDNGDGDTILAEGVISTLISTETVDPYIVNAISRPERTTPRIVLETSFYETFSDSVKFSVTDTDFTVAENTPGRAFLTGLQEPGNSASFTFAGDANNGEFEEGFILTTYNTTETNVDYTFQQEGSVPAVGSLTLSGVVEQGTNVEALIETSFMMILQIGQLRDCPPNISNETISRLGTIGDGCVIEGSTIENGNVSVKGVTSFSMSRSVVSNGDVDIEDVGGAVTVQENSVNNGDIEITGTTAPNVRDNIVHGKIAIRENDSPSVIRNAFNNNMVVNDNTGSTVVDQNTGSGSSNLEVNNNATAAVTNNTTGRDILCRDNDNLIADGNKADRKLECPKTGLFD